MDPVVLSRTAAAIAAAAIYELFPGSECLGGGESSTGFFYQFLYSRPIPPEAPQMLEEHMRQIIREDRPLRNMEMVAYSAKELFTSTGHLAAVDRLEDLEPKELVSVMKIGSFCDLMEGPFCKTVRDIGAFHILTMSPLGDHEYRVEGCAFAAKDQLKKYLRKYRRYAEENHISLGQELGFWQRVGTGFFWKRRGLFAKRAIVALFRTIFSDGEEARFAQERTLEKIAMQRVRKGAPLSLWVVADNAIDPEGDSGFFEEHCQSFIEQRYYCEEEDLDGLVTLLLQTVGKAFTILGFRTEVSLIGRRQSESLRLLERALGATLGAALFANGLKISPEGGAISKIQWTVQDGLGRSQTGLELSLQQTVEEKGLFVLRIKAGVERILSLLLEQNVGNLPNWLIPEHIRMLVLGGQMGGQNSAYGNELCAAIENRGYRAAADLRLISLKEKLFEAIREKVPLVAMIGDRELQAKIVALRDARSGKPEDLTLEQLIERMNRTFKLEN